MLIKAGVDISRLNREIRRSLKKLDLICKTYKAELIITSTYEGNHGANSLHYSDDAIDIRWIRQLPKYKFRDLVRSALGKDFDIVAKPSHLHAEYDP